MKAVIINDAGGPEVLRLSEVESPSPGPNDLLVDVAAAGLNFIDTYHRSGLYPMEFPIVPGVEGAGTVLEVGTETSGFSVGDRVAWSGALGSYREQHVVPASSAVPVPDPIDLDLAAAVLLQGLTAHYLAVDTFPLTEDHTCLIHAGAGGVGLLLTQIAKIRGARVVATVGSSDKVELSREAGADEVIDYTETDFQSAVEDLFGKRPIDVVYDGVGAATFDKGLALLRPRGTMVTFGNASGPVPEVAPLRLTQEGSVFLTRPTLGDYVATRDELMGRVADLFSWVESGDLSVRIDSKFPLADAAKAHEALEGRTTTGKVLLIP